MPLSMGQFLSLIRGRPRGRGGVATAEHIPPSHRGFLYKIRASDRGRPAATAAQITPSPAKALCTLFTEDPGLAVRMRQNPPPVIVLRLAYSRMGHITRTKIHTLLGTALGATILCKQYLNSGAGLRTTLFSVLEPKLAPPRTTYHADSAGQKK